MFPLEHMDAWAQEHIGLIEKLHPDSLHGVGVITKLYFVIFAALKISMTLNLAQRSFKVIHCGGNRKPVYDFTLAVDSNFCSIFSRFRDLVGFVC